MEERFLGKTKNEVIFPVDMRILKYHPKRLNIYSIFLGISQKE